MDSLISSPIVDLLCWFHFSVCLSDTLLRKYILGHPPPKAAFGNAFYGLHFNIGSLIFFSFTISQGSPFVPLPHFLGILRFWSLYSNQPQLFCIVEVSLTTTDFVGFWDPNRKQGLSQAQGSLGEMEEESTLNMQPGVLDPPSGLCTAHQLSTLDRNPSPSSGKEVFSNTVFL